MSTPPERNGPEQGPEGRTPDQDPTPESAENRNEDGTEELPPAVVYPGDPGFPPPPESIVEAAKVAPDHWLGVVDQNWQGEEGEEPPSWATLGRWRTDGNGEIVEWERNDEYRPSPERMGWPEPVGPADRAVQLAATGYGPEGEVARSLADAEIAVCVDDEGNPSVTETPEGVPAVAVFSAAPGMDMDELPPHRMMPMPALVERLRGQEQVLFLSSSAPVALLIDKDELRPAPDDAAPDDAGAGEEARGDEVRGDEDEPRTGRD
ncbi:type VII secretion system-associated protein [Streptomyces sp. ODS28]|uniref:type VII secretion system-associated protein n=1 Tax=Streptomyces sp. ODS28 TaxID=3136688 RepID=UPI0031E8D944